MDYSLKQIADITGGKLIGDGTVTINQLITDSRQPVAASGSLFFAIKGPRNDGHQYIKDLIAKRNVVNFIVENEIHSEQKINQIIVDNSVNALQKLAAYHRSIFKCPVIGITGSNGKTIVKEWLYQLLQSKYSIVRSPKSYNSQTGVPLSVWNLNEKTELAIFEAGISEQGEMSKLQAIIKPEIGIFTNIGEAHQENFYSIQRKIREKLNLFRDTKVLLYCLDHEAIAEEIEDWVNDNQQLVCWSAKQKADLQIIRQISQNNGTTLIGIYKGVEITINIPFTDSASIENAINCWLLVLHLGIDKSVYQSEFAALSPVALRLEQKKGINGCSIINDSYNSDLYSLGIALDFLSHQQQLQKTLILSDILQSGRLDSDLYQHVADLIEIKQVQRLIGIGTSISSQASLFKVEKEFYTSTEEFISHFQPSRFQNEAILLKGARNFEFERISSFLEEKAHRTTLEINMTAMVHNLNYFKSKLRPGTKLIAMVKAFSYGSGSYEVANMLEYQKVDYLAVAFADEGVALRQSGISMPIIVMNPEASAFRLMIDFRLEPEIYSFKELRQFADMLKAYRIDNYPVHLKVDTGMHRLGFMPEEIDSLCEEIKKNKVLKVESVFSHLAGADEEQHDDYTIEQIELFQKICSKIQASVGYPLMRHILNSSGIDRFSEYQFEMVRLGIGLYGVIPSNQEQLQWVSTLKTSILQIKEIETGKTIGYGRKGKALRKTKIAVIPIGYADGYSRMLSNSVGRVFVNGLYAPVIGNICMDMCMIDITGIKANEGDEVEIFGKNVTILELADKMHTIPYEVLTSIAPRVKRVYVQE